jgi:signal transduction histidine kinase
VTLPAHDVPLRDLLEDAAGKVEDGRDRDIAVEIVGVEDGQIVSGDRTRLTAALAALLRAVVREQTEPGRVLMEVAERDADGRRVAAIGIARDTELPGQAEPALEAALNETRGGMGLSLPIARRVIARHGGRVWSSAGGRLMGTVALWLPLKEKRS